MLLATDADDEVRTVHVTKVAARLEAVQVTRRHISSSAVSLEADHDLRCARCGYGVATGPPQRCPMCGSETSWVSAGTARPIN
jgi:rubrerythrin